MSARTQNKAKRISGGQPAASEEPEVFLYEGGEVAEELRRSLTRVRVGPQVTEIPDDAFRDCHKLIELQFNEGLKVIGGCAFYCCFSLRSVTVPSTVTKLSRMAFTDCYSLTELQLNDGLQVIDENAFTRCTSLRSVTLPSSVTEIGKWAFWNCSDLIALRLKEGLQFIGACAFADCTALRSVTIPSTVTELGMSSFADCSNLSEVIFLDGKRLLNQEFVNCGFRREEQGLLDKEALHEMLFSCDEEFDEDKRIVFHGCPLITAVKISISWAVSERMARLPRECKVSVEQRIRNLRRLQLLQDGNRLACFHVVRMSSGDESEDESDYDAEYDIFEVRDTNYETARSVYRVLQLIAFYELKESSILLELAMWKSGIDGASSIPRADCRVAIPDPAKSLIMEYGGFAGFLEPVIEGA